ncbi:MAG: tRNA pseudouridine55 synthase [Solirubrobacteraceae bacterium]|jgi:tRNA pseudouridine55 synthase|nr:tRNA pseudouridine55 synthase [Solirubrobacteraceae bacterium]MEA2300476.1 tRNA pseudouridine55 synthase [Solirubrobacteraceae bacterium]MEA2356516.1 tRNA pseudouridine55 synthase [Solirubrobacteraceae bacterium]
MVARARRALGKRRVGHAGTLDPFATGLLILLIGRATRVQRYLMELPKTYEVVARFGATSTTGDPEGDITETGVLPEPDLVLPGGLVRQRPPAHSAVKIDGERAYARARRGEDVVTAERTVEVHAFDELWREGDRAGFRIVCSSGTYVRSLVADLGDAYCLELRRTAIGPFGVDGGWPGHGRAEVLDLADGLGRIMPVVELDGEEAAGAAHGRPVARAAMAPGAALLVDASGPIAVAEERDGGGLRPVVGFRG